MLFYISFILALVVPASQSQKALTLRLASQLKDEAKSLSTDNQGMKTVAIQGIAKFKPGGGSMLLSLLVKGEPGLMPGVASTPPVPQPSPQSPQATTTAPPSSGTSGPATTQPPPGSTPASTAATTSSPTDSTSGGQFEDYQEEGLAMHNSFRKVHNSQPMSLDKQLCEEAQAYAEKIAQTGSFKHSSKNERRGAGENLSMGCSTNKAQTVTEGVTNWYNEVCNPGYDFNRGRGQSGTGHFTQVVWNDSVKLGIGRAEVKDSGMLCAYIVGRYEPPGNFDTNNNDYQVNVKTGSFEKSSYCKNVKRSYDGTKRHMAVV